MLKIFLGVRFDVFNLQQFKVVCGTKGLNIVLGTEWIYWFTWKLNGSAHIEISVKVKKCAQIPHCSI